MRIKRQNPCSEADGKCWVSRNKPRLRSGQNFFLGIRRHCQRRLFTAIDETPIEFCARRSRSCRLLHADQLVAGEQLCVFANVVADFFQR